MTRHISIVQGHPDPARHHLLHAMADAYAEAATAAGHEVRRIEVARLEFPRMHSGRAAGSGFFA
nr:NAD(P)H-dependent oxidoreductase [Sinorhizobium meliloti]